MRRCSRWPATSRVGRACSATIDGAISSSATAGVWSSPWGGWIRGWPSRWTAVQEALPEQRRLRFHHIRGITTGMNVEWRFEPSGRGVDVELAHELALRWPVIGRFAGDWIVGPVFIDYITHRTLRAVKAEAERVDAESRGA